MPLDEAARRTGGRHPVQGNLDPAVLFADRGSIEAEVRRIVDDGRRAPGHVFNLGHGVLPETDPDVLTRLVELVHSRSRDGREWAGAAGRRRRRRASPGWRRRTGCARCSARHAAITVLEQRDRLGGVLRTVELAGVPYDVGAEAFLVAAARGDGAARRAGLADAVHPTGGGARRSGRRADRAAARAARCWACRRAGPAGRRAVARPGSRRWPPSPAGRCAWEPGGDVALGGLLRARFGDELADRLVDPLLGGVYAGRVDALGLRATMPALAAALDAGAPSLTAAADAAPPRRSRESADAVRSRRFAVISGDSPSPETGIAASRRHARPPVFGALPGGYRVLLDALARPPAPRCGCAPPCAP